MFNCFSGGIHDTYSIHLKQMISSAVLMILLLMVANGCLHLGERGPAAASRSNLSWAFTRLLAVGARGWLLRKVSVQYCNWVFLVKILTWLLL